MTEPTVAYIDADILLHRAVAFTEDEFEGEEIALPLQALWIFSNLLKRWLKEIRDKVELKDYHLVISVGRNFRYGIYPDYKGNRKDIKPHPAFDGLKTLVMELDDTRWEEGIEADDYIGIHVTRGDGAFAVSADKDFATLPCTLFVPASHGKKEGTWHTFTKGEADTNWLRQSMQGDVIDNYKGIPKIGPKKALAILGDSQDERIMVQNVLAAFKSNRLTDDYAISMIRLARILRDGEYDFNTKEVKLWEPPSAT